MITSIKVFKIALLIFLLVPEIVKLMISHFTVLDLAFSLLCKLSVALLRVDLVIK